MMVVKLTGEALQDLGVDTQSLPPSSIERANSSNIGSPSCSYDYDSLSSSQSQSVKWSDEGTELLLQLYYDNFKEIGPFKRFKNKKAMWAHISSEINSTFDCQPPKCDYHCDNRFKTVKRRKDHAVSHNHTSGNNRVEIPHRDVFEKIKQADNSLMPEILASIGNIQTLKTTVSDSDDCCDKKVKPNKYSKEKLLVNTLEKIHREKEKNRERRHKEKLELIKQLLEKKD